MKFYILKMSFKNIHSTRETLDFMTFNCHFSRTVIDRFLSQSGMENKIEDSAFKKIEIFLE